jgi:protein-S-isoprenylcysteine O-methyltransferase Ste14
MSPVTIFFLVVVAPALALILALLGLETTNTNRLGWILLVIGISYPTGIVAYYWIRKKPFWESYNGGDTVAEEIGNKSFWLILPGMLVTFLGPPLETIYLPAFLPRSAWMQIIGFAFILAGALLRLWARMASNDEYGSYAHVTRRYLLIEDGPYRYLRHPGYAGYFLLSLGISIGYSSVIGLMAVPILMLPGFAYRMNVEEKLLEKAFGKKYKVYSSRTKRIIPGIW